MFHLQNFMRYELVARALAPLHIPPFGGSMIRGALGHALHFSNETAYTHLFETGEGHAFVITPPKPAHLGAGETFRFFITLFRTAPELQSAFFDALNLAFNKGLGNWKTPCELLDITPLEPHFMPLQQSVRLKLASPWYIKYKGQPVKAVNLNLANFLIALTQRQRELVKRGYLQANLPDNTSLLAMSDALQSKMVLQDVVGERLSNRQHTKHPLQGVIGQIEILAPEKNPLTPLGPLLHRAQWLHGGSKTGFGLGAMEIQPIAAPVSQLNQLQHLATGAKP